MDDDGSTNVGFNSSRPVHIADTGLAKKKADLDHADVECFERIRY